MNVTRGGWAWAALGLTLAGSACNGGGRVPEDVLGLVKAGGPEARLEITLGVKGELAGWAARGLKPEQAPSDIAGRARAYYPDGTLVTYELARSPSGEVTHEVAARQTNGQLCRVAFMQTGERVWAECAFGRDAVPEAVKRGLTTALAGGAAGPIEVRRTLEGERARVRVERGGHVEWLAVDAKGTTHVTHRELQAVVLSAE